MICITLYFLAIKLLADSILLQLQIINHLMAECYLSKQFLLKGPLLINKLVSIDIDRWDMYLCRMVSSSTSHIPNPQSH